jgi:hypothetical protein
MIGLGIGGGITSLGSGYTPMDLQEATSGTIPAPVLNLALWLKNNTGVTAARWTDSSGNSRDAEQGTSGNQAEVTSDGGLDFERDNSDHYDFTKIDVADNGGFCIALVLTRESNTSGTIFSDGTGEMFQISNNTTLRIKTTTSGSGSNITTDAVLPADTFDTGEKMVLLVNRSAGASNRFIFMKNGVALTADVDTSSNEASGENPSGIEFTVLGSLAGSSQFFDGIVHEAAIWQRGLTAQEIADVNSYLLSIHGL